jgi:GAF domain-containing protein/HAMP domain-containing protein
VNQASPNLRSKGIGLRGRIALSFILLAALSSAITLTIIFLNFQQQLRDAFRQRLINIVTIASLQVDGDAFAAIQSADDPEYQQIHDRNTEILLSDPDLIFVYTMRFDEDGLYFVVDAGDPAGPAFSPYGTRYFEPGPVLSENYRSLSQPLSEEDIYSDEYGSFLSAYAPIRNRAGQTTGIIGADISADKILAGERQLLLITAGIFLATLPIIVLLGWVMGNNLAGPLRALTTAATRIASGELDYRPLIKSGVPEIKTLNASFFSMADQQASLIQELEQRVEVRTRELSATSDQLQRRLAQLQTIYEVAHSISLIQDINRLLVSIARLISEQFGFYHVGIFLLDENNEYAVLRATNSEGGARMLARGHRLKVGKEGIVGYVAERAKPRIVLDVGSDAIYFNNPDLPETRSEMALPLLARERVIGVLDIQSKETNAFREDDFSIFNTLADQAAIAIENARLLDETRRTLEDAERIYGQFLQKGWSSLLQTQQIRGIRHSIKGTEKLSDFVAYPEIKQALQTGSIVAKTGKNSSLALPLVIRGQTIAVLNIRLPEERQWRDEDIDMLQRIVDRAALALENARLIKSTQLSAQKERTIGEISAKISASVNIRNVLQTAVEELGRALPGSLVEIQLENKK